ncbi:MAG TPA: hypothetical protein PLO41_21580, partial [Rubrivivax sp.]|nr:hypothetical protein [Rubrivivax sp.]
MSIRTLLSPRRGAAPWARTARVLWAGALAALLSLGACGDDDVVVDRGPTEIPITAKLNGLYWDSTESRLYLGDDDTNSIKVWDGRQGFSVAATLTPPPASGPNLGQLTRDAGGTFYVTRCGFGQHGAVVGVPGSGVAFDLGG